MTIPKRSKFRTNKEQTKSWTSICEACNHKFSSEKLRLGLCDDCYAQMMLSDDETITRIKIKDME